MLPSKTRCPTHFSLTAIVAPEFVGTIYHQQLVTSGWAFLNIRSDGLMLFKGENNKKIRKKGQVRPSPPTDRNGTAKLLC